MELAGKLKVCRAKKGLTQAEVAEKLHLSRKTVSGWETGRSYPDIKTLTQLSRLYDISLDDLMNSSSVLNHYAEQDKLGRQVTRIFKVTYYLNVFLLILSYVDLFRPYHFHSPLIPLAMIINLIVLITHYSEWRKFKKLLLVIGLLLVLLLVFSITSALIFTNSAYLNSLIDGDSGFNAGFTISRVVLIFFISLGSTSVLAFKPIKKK